MKNETPICWTRSNGNIVLSDLWPVSKAMYCEDDRILMKDTCQAKWHEVCNIMSNLHFQQKLTSGLTEEMLLKPIRKMEPFGDEMEAYCDELLSIFQKTKNEAEMVEKAQKYLSSI